MKKRIGTATIGDNAPPFEVAYKKMRVVCQIVHARLEFLKDNLRKARNAESEVDRHEGLFEARGEINFIQAHTEPLQKTYHGYSFNKKTGKTRTANDTDVAIIEDKHGKEIAEAEKLILELNKADQKATALADEDYEKWGFEDSNR
tara:strand:+ start:646 stop:1083 length:438 start_codon:yes stop_codon:yes gene_type:complete